MNNIELARYYDDEIKDVVKITVSDYKNPVEALEYFRRHSDKFDLIITDMTMPKMTGDKLAAQVHVIRPDMPIIMCTGFSEIISKEKAQLLGITALLTKPVPVKDFATVVRKALDESS